MAKWKNATQWKIISRHKKTIQFFKFNDKLQQKMRRQSKKKCVSSHSNRKKCSPIYILHHCIITANSVTHVNFTYILMCACVLWCLYNCLHKIKKMFKSDVRNQKRLSDCFGAVKYEKVLAWVFCILYTFFIVCTSVFLPCVKNLGKNGLTNLYLALYLHINFHFHTYVLFIDNFQISFNRAQKSIWQSAIYTRFCWNWQAALNKCF